MARQRKVARESSYEEASRARFGNGGGWFGFGAGGGGLPWVFLWFVVAFAVVVGKLFYLQVIAGPHYAEGAVARREDRVETLARRGTIYDRNGNILAVSEDCYDVSGNPQEVKDPAAVAVIVAKWLGGDAQDYEELLKQEGGFVYLERNADKDACDALVAELYEKEYAGIHLDAKMRRVYPYGEVCGQILGACDVDGNGISGLELAYNDELAGTPGKLVVETGYAGIPLSDAQAEVTEPVDGKDLVLSIDVDVQEVVEREVEKAAEENEATSGFCMVTDPRSGEVLAACSTPYADLSHPESVTNEALKLKVVSDSFDPGSTFKVLTAAVALESGSMETGSYYKVPPTIWVGEGLVGDDDGRFEYTDMNLREMLRRSSNVAAVLFAEQAIGAQSFSEGIDAFGIGHMTGIDYPGEAAGMVKKLSEYDGSTLGSMSFGQGLSIPMVQMVRAVGGIANGGVMMTPHFALSLGSEDIDWGRGERAVSEGCAEKVADMMLTVTQDGTGWSSAVEGYDVATKTGTGEQARDGKYIEGKYLSSVIGFAPARAPEVLVYIGLNETPQKSYDSAGPAFSAIMGEVLADMGVLSDSRGW